MQTNDVLAALTPSAPDASQTRPSGDLGREDFLRMLIAQLENQDPLNPQDATQFTAQLAQFSSLEQLISIRSAVEQSAGAADAGQALSPDALLGHEVLARSDQVTLGEGAPAELLFDLSQPAREARVVIRDAAGQPVRALSLGRLAGGRHSALWDGSDSLGRTLPAGVYRFEVEAVSSSGAVEATPLIRGRVTSIPTDAGRARDAVRLGDVEVALTDLLEIRDGSASR